MTSAQLNLLAKARQSLSAAKLMLDGEYPDYAASRAYYTMFYIAEAFLEDKGLSFSKSGVISAFDRKFARTGRVPVKFHQYLIRAQELRNAGDYGELDAVTNDQAAQSIAQAEEFLELAQNAIGTLPPP
jgi:uncharacterized protein (UPF0332 family)